MELEENLIILIEKINNIPTRTVRSKYFPKLSIPDNITKIEDIIQFWKTTYNLK